MSAVTGYWLTIPIRCPYCEVIIEVWGASGSGGPAASCEVISDHKG